MITRLLVLLLVFSPIIFSGFINAGNDTNYLTSSALRSISLFPQTWESYLGGVDLGHNQIISMWMQPLLAVLSLLGRAGLNFGMQTKLIVFLELIVGIIGIEKLFKRFGISSMATTVGTVFYLANTYFLTLVDGGLVFVAGAYSLFPLLLNLGLETLSNLNSKNLSRTALLLITAQLFDIRVIPLFFGCLFLANRKRSIPTLAFLAVVVIGWNMFWIWPAIRSKVIPNFSYAISSQISQFSLFSPGHLLTFSQPHWFNNLFGDVQPVRWYLWLLPAIIIIPIITGKSSKYFIALTLIGLFLSKGNLPPLGQVYDWLYASIPGFAIFRDPSKFIILISLGYSGLLAQAVGSRKIIGILITTYLLLVVSPVYLGKLNGAFSPQPLQKDYERLANVLEENTNFGRILWVPSKPPLGPVLPHKIWTESKSLLDKFPFLNLIDGSYELLNYLRSPLAPYYLDAIGAEYIIYPYPDERKKILKPDEREYYYWFRNWFTSQSWLTDISWSDKLGVFKTQNRLDRFFLLDHLQWVVGDYSFPATPSGAIINLENGISFNPRPQDEVFFNRTNTLDLIMTQVPREYLLPATKSVTGSQWWKKDSQDFLFVKNYLLDRYRVKFNDTDLGFGYALAEGYQESDEISFDRTGDLYLRVLSSEAGGDIWIIGEHISTLSQGNNFAWVRVGPYQAGQKFKVIANGRINIINAFAIVPPDKISEISSLVLQKLNQNKIRSTSTYSRPIAYKQISPTHYQIDISQANVWLVFSESFDSNWQLTNSQTKERLTPLPVFNLLNAYFISQAGTYTLYYQPQQYVPSGVVISLSTLILLISLWLGSKYAKK